MAAIKYKQCNNQNSFKIHKCDAESVIQELKEKMNRLKFRLFDCQNQNQMLRKELLLAKKVVDKEVSHTPKENFLDLLNQASGLDFQGRREKIMLLKDKLRELQDRIKEMEDGTADKLSEEQTTTPPKVERLEEHKKYQSKKMIDKELQYLLENSCQIKRKLEVWKKRNVELSKDAELLRLELESLLKKNEEHQSIRESYQVVEKELRATQKEKLDMRSKLDVEKTRNEQLEKELAALREDISMFLTKVNDDKVLIEALTNQQGYLQDLLERQTMISESDNRRFRDDLIEIQTKHATNNSTLSHLHDIVAQKSLECLELQESTKQKECVLGFESAKEEQETSATDAAADSEQSQQGEPQLQPSPARDVPAESNEEATSEVDAEEEKLNDECEEYRNILRALQEEIDQMTNMMSSNDAKLAEWMSQLFQTRSLVAKRDAEIRDLEETAKKLQKALSFSTKKCASPQLGSKFLEEMIKTSDVLNEEYQFLVSLWELLISRKENSMEIYTMSIAYEKNCFVDAINKLITTEDVTNLEEQPSQAENEDPPQ